MSGIDVYEVVLGSLLGGAILYLLNRPGGAEIPDGAASDDSSVVGPAQATNQPTAPVAAHADVASTAADNKPCFNPKVINNKIIVLKERGVPIPTPGADMGVYEARLDNLLAETAADAILAPNPQSASLSVIQTAGQKLLWMENFLHCSRPPEFPPQEDAQ